MRGEKTIFPFLCYSELHFFFLKLATVVFKQLQRKGCWQKASVAESQRLCELSALGDKEEGPHQLPPNSAPFGRSLPHSFQDCLFAGLRHHCPHPRLPYCQAGWLCAAPPRPMGVWSQFTTHEAQLCRSYIGAENTGLRGAFGLGSWVGKLSLPGQLTSAPPLVHRGLL